jgi:transcriptional regulator
LRLVQVTGLAELHASAGLHTVRPIGSSLLLSKRNRVNILWETNMAKKDVQQGTLALMVLKTLDVLGTLHGYGIARRIEQISGDLLAVNQGTLYPVLLKLEQEGAIASEWGTSENNRRARFYRLTRAGRKQLQAETENWEETAALIERFFAVKAEDLQ